MRIAIRLFVFCALAAGALQAQSTFSAGAAKRVITPCSWSFPPGTPCPDYVHPEALIYTTGGSAKLVTGVDNSDHNLDRNGGGTPADLTVRALVLQDSAGARVAIITADLLGVSAEFVQDVRARIVAAHSGFTSAGILINVSHTHNAPAVRHLVGLSGSCPHPFDREAPPAPKYVDEVKTRMVETVGAAVAKLEPATLHFSRGTTDVGVLRRSEHQKAPPAPPRDFTQALDVLQVKAGDNGALLAILFAAGVHPVTTYGGAYISADFPSYTRKALENFSPDVVALFLQGFGGDVNPKTDKQSMSDDLLNDVRAAAALPATVLQGKLAADSRVVALPLNPHRETWGITTSQPTLQSWVHDGSTALRTELQMIRIGEAASAGSWALLASSHEVVSEWISDVRNAIPEWERLTLAGYSNGVESYLPTARMIGLDKADCDYSPYRYEGCGSFRVYHRPLPAWTDAAFLTPIAELSEQMSGSLADPFTAPARSVHRWNEHVLGVLGCSQPRDAAVTVAQSGGELRITPLASAEGYHYNGYVSTRTFDFRGRAATVEIKGHPTASGVEMLMSIGPGSHLFRFDVQGNGSGATLWAHFSYIDGSPAHIALGNYDPLTQRYLRIRHDKPTDRIVWETSADAANWTQVYQLQRHVDVSAVRAELIAGTWVSVPAPGVAKFGRFELK